MRRIQDLVKEVAGKAHYVLARYETLHRRTWMDTVTAIKQERSFLLTHGEACQLISAVTATEKLAGDMAELGVAYGASAKLISEYAPSRTLHLFDTFGGLPAGTDVDSPKFAKGQFASKSSKTFRSTWRTGTSGFTKGYFRIRLIQYEIKDISSCTWTPIYMKAQWQA